MTVGKKKSKLDKVSISILSAFILMAGTHLGCRYDVGAQVDKFFQEDYNKAGSGLGLAISNEIVKLHGGKMILNSKKGVGTSITVKIKNTLIKSI